MSKKGKRNFSQNAISNAYAAINNIRKKNGSASSAAAFDKHGISNKGYQDANKDSKGRYRHGRRQYGKVNNGAISSGNNSILKQKSTQEIQRQRERERKRLCDDNIRNGWSVQENNNADSVVINLQNDSQHLTLTQADVFGFGEKINPIKLLGYRYTLPNLLNEIKEKFIEMMLHDIETKNIKKTTKLLNKIFSRFLKEIKKNISLGKNLINDELEEKLGKIKDKKIKNDKMNSILMEILKRYDSRMVIDEAYKIEEEEYNSLGKYGSSNSSIVDIWKKMDSAEIAIFENTQKRKNEVEAIDFVQSLRSKDLKFCKYPPSQFNYTVDKLISIYEKNKLITEKIEEPRDLASTYPSFDVEETFLIPI